MYADVKIQVDLTAIETRLDAIEGMGATVLSALVIPLKHIRLEYLYLLDTKQDGDEIRDEDANIIIWDAVIRTQVQDELTQIETLITALESP